MRAQFFTSVFSAAVLCAATGSPSLAVTHYVDGGNATPSAPYTNWATAATVIQDAINASIAGDTVLVTNGTYNTGGAVVHSMTNRVALDKAITVQSVNGPEHTFLIGNGPRGPEAVRCAYVTNGAELIGFTLANGYTHTSGDPWRQQRGGGVFFDGGGRVQGCIITSSDYHGAFLYGGGTLESCLVSGNPSCGVYCYQGGTLNNCVVVSNTAAWTYAGGVHCYNGGVLNNCTVSDNSSAGTGGGVSCANGGALNNCIVWDNPAGADINWYNLGSGMTYSNCCTRPNVGINGVTNDPLFVATGDYHLQPASPCISAGFNLPWPAGSTDFDGNNRIAGAAIDIGAYEFQLMHTGNSPLHYVSTNGSNIWPYTNWISAANFIQDAVETAVSSDLLLVADGVYSNGSAVTPGYACLNRVVITNDITVRSVNGPEHTFILGAPDPVSGGLGSNAVRGVYLSAGTLSGFTITNGHTMTAAVSYDYAGGGIFQPNSGSGITSNCVLSGNAATRGGGNYGGTLHHCTLTGNSAIHSGGGNYIGTLRDCVLSENTATSTGGGNVGGKLYDCTLSGNAAAFGGGSIYGMLTNCVLSGNLAYGDGGGIHSGTAYDCIFSNNIANQYGGGCDNSTLHHCTLSGNTATNTGGGSHDSTLYNCTLSGNSSYAGGGSSMDTLRECRLISNSATDGGGSWGSLLYNCLLSGNVAQRNGGGCYRGTMHNCTITGNSAAGSGGGIYFNDASDALTNCIVWGNGSPDGDNWNPGASSSTFSHCNTAPVIGDHCVTNDPQFVALDDFRLQPISPCINSGTNLPWMAGTTDVDGHTRILAGVVDIGAYEDWIDTDSDGLTDWAENNLYGTDPLDIDTDDDSLLDSNEVAWGSNPLADSSGIVAYGEALGEANVIGDPEAFGLYTTNSIMDLSMGYLMLQTTASNTAYLWLQLEQSTNLVDGAWTNAGDAVWWEGPAVEGKAFFRVRGGTD